MLSISLSVFAPFEIVLLSILCISFLKLIDSLVSSFLTFAAYFGDQSSISCGVGEEHFPFGRELFCPGYHVLGFPEASQYQPVTFMY